MGQRATLLLDQKQPANPSAKKAPALRSTGATREHAPAGDPRLFNVTLSLRDLLLLLRSHRLYDPAHPRVVDSLDAAYDSLRRAAIDLDGLEIRVERGGIVVAKVSEGHLPDARGEFHALATDLQRASIHTLYFATKFHVGELDTLARLIQATLLRSEEPAHRVKKDLWPAQLREHRVEGIQVNTLTDRKVDTVLASLIAALVAYGGNAPHEGDTPIHAPQIQELTDTLRLIGNLTLPMESARGLSPEEAARAIHHSME
ncbi:MAG TPA: hypothetical protein VGF19_05215, partial [Candidatus Acidoferrum sp.]